MADTTFVDYSTVVPAAWLNDVNDLTYSGQFPLTTQSVAIGAAPLTYASQGASYYVYNAGNATGVPDNALLRLHSVNRNANIQLISVATGTASYSWLDQAGVFLGDMQYAYSVGDILWRTTPAGVATETLRLTQAGSLQMKGASSTLGYGTGSGGAVTQLTNKSTAVTINKGSGKITLANSALAAGVTNFFGVNNSLVSANDTIAINIQGIGAAYSYTASVYFVAAGAFNIAVTNITGGSLSESPTINFTVLKGSIT